MTNHRLDQLIRFIRLFLVTFLSTGILASDHLTRDAVIATAVAALETTYRQFFKVAPVGP